MERGPVYTFRFARDETNRATEAMVQLEYSPTAPTVWDANTRVFLVAEYFQGVRVTHQGGNIVKVENSIG